MAKDSSDSIAFAGLAGLLGYAFGKGQYNDWDNFIKGVNVRVNHITYLKVIIPDGLFREVPLCQVFYNEAVHAYLYGLPNASIPMFFKCLELGLKKKYLEQEKKSPDAMKSWELIDWSEKFLGKKKELAQGFRILRNILHEDKVIPEQDIPQAIYNSSIILNQLFPYDLSTKTYYCNACKRPNKATIHSHDNFLGRIIVVNCDYCRTASNIKILI